MAENPNLKIKLEFQTHQKNMKKICKFSSRRYEADGGVHFPNRCTDLPEIVGQTSDFRNPKSNWAFLIWSSIEDVFNMEVVVLEHTNPTVVSI